MLDEDRLVLAMVSDSLEEDPPCQQRYLQRLNVDPYSKLVPGIGSEAIGDGSCKETIEIEEEPIHKLPLSILHC